ncbi:TIR domain-containing protein [Parafrankia irregularis]|uniref:TIR domain-containing protein n=1 Tax=Parafrankia irregularis TaxID=795642 RepID=A0A0S4QYP5_9ACTN|nr:MULTISPECIES: TIR domain-containing protein [Parafrankia]MBE3204892.1 TIR domain-containing protein [Parafrankia sp. CH37]CUU60663.1 TIR domain-containing protein [Parafrankia irregularis]
MLDGGHDTTDSADRWDFFVSYTQADRAWAEWIAWQLEADGYRVLLQAWDMVAGTNWAHAMQNGIKDSTRTLAVLSTAYLDSAYGTQEWQAAVAADPDSARRRLIPVRVADCARPGLLGQVVSFDLFGLPEGRARGELMARVREAIAGRAKPVSEPLFPGVSAAASRLRVVPTSAVSPAFPGTGTGAGNRMPAAPERPAEFQALLIGIPSYEDDRLPGLPWLSGMLDTVAEKLESVGYRTEIHDRSRMGAGAVKAAVHSFLRGAAPGSTLLLLLAGHAVHRAGDGAAASRDYLVPADATVGYQPFWDLCVPVDWSGPLARTAAARVLVLVDGDTGFDDDVHALVTDRGWGTGHLDPATGVDVAYLYRGPTAAGAGAHHEPPAPAMPPTDPAARRSLTRALVEVLSAGPRPGTLGELHAALDRAMSPPAEQPPACAATRPRGMPDQPRLPRQRPAGGAREEGPGYENDHCLLRPVSSCDPLRFRPFPTAPGGDGVKAPEHPWVAAADQHRAWERAPDDPVTTSLRAATCVLVGRLGRAYGEAAAVLAEDPWHDPDLARRMARRVEFLVGKLPAGPEELSAAEVALLVAGPYLHQTVWTALVAQATVTHPGSADVLSGRADRAEFDAFTHTHPRLTRRIERARLSGDQTSAASVTWWLAHKFCESTVTARWEAVLREVLPGPTADGAQETLAAEVFRPERIAEILTCLRAAPTFLNQSGRAGALRDLVTVAPATSEESPLRERLVAYLLAVGQKMALEIAALPPVLVEHLGVADAVDLAEVRSALRRAEWQGRGRSTRALSVECRHPALQIALERHAASLDALLAEAHRVTAEIPALAGLPTHATADGVHAAEIDGHPVYASAGAQFRLAEDRVQELLMGEQLYENRALAVRELYQNALDACRYRRARTQYLERTTGRPSGWTGRIDFRQGFEPDGTPFIECRDNGIGMGYREISDVFAEAGTRTVDLPEAVEEMGRWAACDPPVEFYPNSRFGVGVLSYFMIADEIRVETCRLGPDGRPGELLRVTIAGPGNLFRIEPLGPGRDSGTSVRLYLSRDPERPPISCVDILRRILWVAEFETHAAEGAALEHWPAGQLAPSAPVGRTDPPYDELRRLTTQIVSAGRGVWWCNGVGAILADGLWVGEAVFGVVLDLTGALVPELSVDRNKIRKLLDEPAVDALLTAAIPALRTSVVLEVTVDWLIAFGYSFPLAADAVLEAMAADGESWDGVGGVRVPVARTGLIAIDSGLGPVAGRTDRPAARSGTSFLQSAHMPDASFFVRMADWASAEDHFPAARSGLDDSSRVVPSDFEILTMVVLSWRWMVPVRFRAFVGFTAGRLRCPPRVVGRRMRRLGYQVPSLNGVEVAEITELDRALLSTRLDGGTALQMWDSRNDVIAPGHVIAAAGRLLMSWGQIVDRLRTLGLVVWPQPVDLAGVAPMDLVQLSEGLDGRYPWLSAGRVSLAHIFRSALHTESGFAEVCARLRRFGYRTPRIDVGSQRGSGKQDAFIVSRDSAGALGTVPIPTSYLTGLRSENPGGRDAAVARLRELGFPVARSLRLPNDSRAGIVDRIQGINELHPLWTTGAPVDRAHLLLVANATKMSFPALVALLGMEGYTTAHVPEPRASRVARISEINSLLLADISRVGRCEIRHLLNMAGATGLPVGASLALLAEVGVATPDIGDLEITNDDGIILSRSLDGAADLAREDDFVPAAQVRAAATRLRREPEDVARRLRQLGLATADPAGWAASPVRPEDIAQLARDFDDHLAFLPDGSVAAAHVMRVAARTGEAPRTIASRLHELGFDVDFVAERELTADEECAVVDLLDVTDEPGFGHGWAGLSRASILATSYRDSIRRRSSGPTASRACQPEQMAAWVGTLGEGLDGYVGARFPEDLGFDDVDLLSWALDGEPPWLADDAISLGHVLAAAGITGRSPHEIAGRLRHLGFTLADLPGRTPDDVDSVDVILLSRFLDGDAPRLTDHQVPLAHIYHAACVLSCDVAEIRERLDRLGLEAPGDAAELSPQTRALATVAFHRTDTAALGVNRLSPAQTLGVAQFIGRDPRSVCESFAGLGLSAPEADEMPALPVTALTAQDAILLSACLDGRGPWLGRRPASLAHVIAAAGYLRWSPRRVVDRLAELGCAGPMLVDTALDAFVDGMDRQLALLLTNTSGAYVDRPVSRAEVLAASFRFRWSPARIAERMIELGFDVPCAASLISG